MNTKVGTPLIDRDTYTFPKDMKSIQRDIEHTWLAVAMRLQRSYLIKKMTQKTVQTRAMT